MYRLIPSTEQESIANEFRHLTGSLITESKKRALVVAVQYKGQQWGYYGPSMELDGCYADAKDIIALLRERNYSDICVLADIPTLLDQQPTRDNIMKAIKWLVKGCRSGDQRFFYFAGHGTQVNDLDGDESDGKDEAIIPCDWATSIYRRQDKGLIIDDDLRRQLVDPLPVGSTLTAVFDSCHSGTILDMDQELTKSQHGPRVESVILKDSARPYIPVRANVICWSACQDAQYAWDIRRLKRGCMTLAFTTNMRRPSVDDYESLEDSIIATVQKEGKPQRPQLWISRPMSSGGVGAHAMKIVF